MNISACQRVSYELYIASFQAPGQEGITDSNKIRARKLKLGVHVNNVILRYFWNSARLRCHHSRTLDIVGKNLGIDLAEKEIAKYSFVHSMPRGRTLKHFVNQSLVRFALLRSQAPKLREQAWSNPNRNELLSIASLRATDSASPPQFRIR